MLYLRCSPFEMRKYKSLDFWMYFVLFGLQASEVGKLQSSFVALDITTNTF